MIPVYLSVEGTMEGRERHTEINKDRENYRTRREHSADYIRRLLR